MSGISVARRPAASRREPAEQGLRQASLGTSVALLVQFAVGMWVSLYVTVPARDQGGGEFAAIGRALANGPAALAVHAGLGLVILLGSVALVVRAIAARQPFFIVTTAVSLLAVLGATGSGAAFVNSGQDGASLSMALLTALALLCLIGNLYRLSQPPATQGTSQGA
jgi:hypothetical protein